MKDGAFEGKLATIDRLRTLLDVQLEICDSEILQQNIGEHDPEKSNFACIGMYIIERKYFS